MKSDNYEWLRDLLLELEIEEAVENARPLTPEDEVSLKRIEVKARELLESLRDKARQEMRSSK